MPDWLIVSLLVLAVLTGVGAAAFLVMRSPAFWAETGRVLIVALLPKIIEVVAKRMPPEKEAEFQKAIRQGREWDHIRKRPKRD